MSEYDERIDTIAIWGLLSEQLLKIENSIHQNFQDGLERGQNITEYSSVG